MKNNVNIFSKKNPVINIILVTILCALTVFPFVLLLSVSFSSEADILYGYKLIPKNFSLDAYRYVFKNPTAVINAYGVTIFSSLSTMVLGTFLMTLIAYPLSRRNFAGKNVLSFYIYFTMLFSGGLVPSYILITQYLKLQDTIWVHILPFLISPWNVFMLRTFFCQIPEEINEAARIDGANEYTIYCRIVLPLSKPVLSTVALLTLLTKWNDWMTSMLYINKGELISLQYLLQRIMEEIALLQDMEINGSGALISRGSIPSETARMAMAVIVAGPALFIFPFFQKYFVKGITVGGVKG